MHEMPQTNSIIILLLIALTAKSDSHNMLVRPTGSDPSTCQNHANCDTLSNILSNNSATLNNSSDLELQFMKGTHKVHIVGTQVKMSNKMNVTWYGDAVIVCEKALTFAFLDINNLKIRGLQFSQCGNELPSNYSMLHNITAALFLSNVHTVHMEGVIIDYNNGYGFLAFNLLGNTQIINCMFLNNNKQCNKRSTQSSCTGGNMALYFFTSSNNPAKQINVSIIDCTIEGGNDLSETSSSCENRQKMPSSPPAFKANGLAVILGQENYQVYLRIHKTSFYHNIGNKVHPAVLVHDYSTMINSVELYDTIFSREGVFLVSTIKRNDIIVANTTPENFTIRNTVFSNGSSFTGVHVCVKPAKVSHTHIQYIAFISCQFYDYQVNVNEEISRKAAIIKIFYGFANSINFPNTLIEIQECTFMNSSIPSISFSFDEDSFLDYSKPTNYGSLSSIFTLKHSLFMPTIQSHSALQVIGPQNSSILWNYAKRNLSIIEFSDCEFSSSIQVNNTQLVLRNCTFHTFWITAVSAKNSVIRVYEQNVFKNSRPGISYGGALRLQESILLLMPNSRTLIKNNSARFGGGIFASPIELDFSDADIGTYSFCTITENNNASQARLDLVQNKAPYSGHSIFGGSYVNCTINCAEKGRCHIMPDTSRFDSQHVPPYINITPINVSKPHTDISSPAVKICLCENNKHTNKCSEATTGAFPGQVFNISLVAMGKLNGFTPVMLASQTESFLLNKDNIFQVLSIKCTTVSYSVRRAWTEPPVQTIPLRIAEETPELIKSKNPENFIINVHMSPCPPGLEFAYYRRKCQCITFFTTFALECNDKTGIISIKNNQWIGYDTNGYLGVAMHYPLDYLNPDQRNISLKEPNKQCNFHRKGILCGACQANLSMVLGTSNCKECTNLYLLLIIPFALAGVALVVLLLKCNLTVSVGHINGIILYANIVQINKVHLFSGNSAISQVFSIFIAWLNLDLGIETCFFENMDSYAKVWLQFVFPVYLWIIIVLIVRLANYFHNVARLIGDTSVPVLATLFLLSYTKLCRTVINAMSFTFIEFESEPIKTIWLKDGNIVYFSPKHAVLFLVALIFLLFYVIPLVLLVLFAPCLQAKSHHKAFKWVNKLKPFLDAYQGPYSNKFRYWTGLLLMVRIPLLIVYTANFKKDLSISFFWTIAVTALIVCILLKKAVYKHRLANWIELISLINVMLLCSVKWLFSSTGYEGLRPIGEYTTYASVAVMMFMFSGITLYQLVLLYFPKTLTRKETNESETVATVQADCEARETIPTSSSVEVDQLREPLLDSS